MDAANETKTVIAEDVEIVGTIKCTGNIEIRGKLDGDLTCGGKAVMGSASNIKGSLSVESISILGQINGNIVAKDRIEMKSSARVNGDIKSKRLTVEDGVTFVGKSEVNPGGAPMPSSSGKPSEQGGNDSGSKDEDKNKTGGMFGRK